MQQLTTSVIITPIITDKKLALKSRDRGILFFYTDQWTYAYHCLLRLTAEARPWRKLYLFNIFLHKHLF